MATISVPNVRVNSDIRFKVTLTDNNVSVDWSSVEELAVILYFRDQRTFGARCTIDGIDGTDLHISYPADRPQFLGIADIVVNCVYQGFEKTFDKPAVNFVDSTAAASGVTNVDEVELEVDIAVAEVDTSILDGAIYAAIKAAMDARNLPYIGDNGHWLLYDTDTESYVDSGVDAKGPEGDPGQTGPAGPEGSPGITSASVSVDANTGTPSVDASIVNKVLTLAFHNLKGATGAQGPAGVTDVDATVDETSGTPSVVASLVDGLLSLAFSGLKGETGPSGISQVSADEQEDGGSISVTPYYDQFTRELYFSFKNLKGETGAAGPEGSPGITGASVSVDANIGTPSVEASIVNKVLTLAFHNLKGATGATGATGPAGPEGSPGITDASVSVDENTGTPSVDASIVNKVLTLAFHNLKGATGAQGPAVPISTDLAADRNDNTKASSVKSIFDAGFKWGVVSQTQTWTGSPSTGYDYTMSNLVYGLIPKANIDLFVSAGVVFNETTGYFELNGLTDISYQEMIPIYSHKIMAATDYTNEGIFSSPIPLRTTLPITSWGANQSVNSSQAFANSSCLETVRLSRQTIYPNRFVAYASFFINSRWLREVLDVIQITGGSAQNTIFMGCSSLETVRLAKVERNTTFKDSPRLSLESVVYAVTNANNSTAITITLHATAYARCQADTTEYTYNGQTYTGILAYAAAKNITIASA